MSATVKFSQTVRTFQNWVNNYDAGRTLDSAELLKQLSILLLGAQELNNFDSSPVSDLEFESSASSEDDGTGNFIRLLPFDKYSKVFDPFSTDANQLVSSSLSDDFADIYSDLNRGLRLFDSGDIDEAQWFWSFSFHSHWARHIVGAIGALQANSSDNILDNE